MMTNHMFDGPRERVYGILNGLAHAETLIEQLLGMGVHAAHIRVGGVAPGGLFQRVENHAAIVDHAAIGLFQRDDAVDVGVIVQHARALDFLDDEAGHCGRAIHAG